MTKLLLFFAAVLLVSSGCHRKLGPYQNMNKWLIPQGNDRRPLNGKPKEVTQYSYMAADTANPAKRQTLSLKYSFDADGNLVKAGTYMNDTLVVTSDNHFDANGLQQMITNMKTGESIQTVTTRLPDGRYKTIANHAKSGPTIVYTSFTGDGKSEVEQSASGNNGARGPSGVHIYYDGYRIMKVTSASPTGALEERFFYSRWDTPDSVNVLTGTGKAMRPMQHESFEMNGHGDPVKRVEFMGKDTTAVEGYQYVYDSQGNWTRRISTSLRASIPGMPMRPATVVDRVFEY